MERYRKRDEKLFFAAYVLWLVVAIVELTLWRKIAIVKMVGTYMQKIAYILLFLKFLLKGKYSKKDVYGILMILFCCVLARYSVYNLHIIPTAIFIYSSADMDYRRVIMYTLAIQGTIMILTIGASCAGIIEDIVWYEGDRIRHSLGYDYCGYPAHLLLFITLMWLVVRKKPHVIDAAVLILLNYAMYVFTDARTDFYLAVFGVAGAFLWNYNYCSKIMNYLRSFVMRYSFFIFAAGSIVVQRLYDYPYGHPTEAMQKLNAVLNYRLWMGLQAIYQYGYTLFGQKIRWLGMGSLRADSSITYNYVDCAYLKELLTFGIIFMCLLGLGFYFTGRIIIKTKKYMFGWCVFISLAYAVINAHLCVLSFNVFILSLGMIFADNGSGQLEENGNETGLKWFDELSVNIGRFAMTLGNTVSAKLSGRIRHLFRTGIFLLILFYITYIQRVGLRYMVSYASMHMWLICGMLLFLTALCCEEENEKNVGNRKLKMFILGFLLLVCVSDFVVDKKFNHAGFGMLAFGGLLCRVWCNMKQPKQLLDEFKLSYKLGFFIVLIYCIVVRPAVPGICYTGIFTNTKDFGISMLIAMAIFMSDMKGVRYYLNIAGAFSALYLVWTTQRLTAILAAALIWGVYAAFEMFSWIKADTAKKSKQLLKAAVGGMIGIAAVLILRKLLYSVAFCLGTQMIYEDDKPEEIGMSVRDIIRQSEWQPVLQPKWQIWKTYLHNMNFLGHKYLLKYNGQDKWTSNSIIMVAFRYGVLAGVTYILMLIQCFYHACKCALRENDSFPIIMFTACAGIGILEAVEMPFVQMVWVVFYFTVCWVLVKNRKDNLT